MNGLSAHYLENPPALHSTAQMDQGRQPAWPCTQHKRKTELLVMTGERLFGLFILLLRNPPKQTQLFESQASFLILKGALALWISCRSNTPSLVLESYYWKGYMTMGLIHKRPWWSPHLLSPPGKKWHLSLTHNDPRTSFIFFQNKRGGGVTEKC